MEDYWYYGLKLSSDLRLTGLPLWTDHHDAPNLVLRQGAVPEALDQTRPGAFLTIARDGTALLNFRGLFRILIRPNGSAVIEPGPEAPMADVEGYLLSFVAGLVLHRCGHFPLHASAVEIGGRAVAICGHSGRGKSTLAAALARAGHRVLSDDITVVRFGEDGGRVDGDGAWAVPGSIHLRLNPDSIEAHRLDPATLSQGRQADNKAIWRRPAGPLAPVPLAALFRLELAPEGADASVTRLSGPGAVLPLQDIVYRFGLGRRLGRGGELAAAALRLASQTAIYRLVRPRTFDGLDATLQAIFDAL